MLHPIFRPAASLALLLLTAPLSTGVAAEPSDRWAAIAQLQASGQLASDLALAYRLAAVRLPELLPAEIAKLPATEMRCATPVFIESIQQSVRGAMSAKAAALMWQGMDRPSNSVGYVDSALYPIRVHYPTGLLDRANRALEYAEASWAFQVQTVGFHAPLGDSGGSSQGDSTALDIYFDSLEGAAGVTVPEDIYWTDTPVADCTSFIIIDRSISGDDLKTTIAHEFNHVLQFTYDTWETNALYENTSSYMMELTYDDIDDYIYFVPEFQARPEYPFEYFDDYGAYQYGGVVVSMTLDEAFGAGDGTLIREIWEGCSQTSMMRNEPDYFDALAAVLSARDGATIDDFQSVLTEWRYLVGERSDGTRLSEGGSWRTLCGDHCLPDEDAKYTLADTPVEASDNPYIHGSSYVRMTLGPRTAGVLKVTFNGSGNTRWAASVFCLHASAAPVVVPVPLSSDGDGSVEVRDDGLEYCTLAVSNLGLGDYDPDNDPWFEDMERHSYSYTIDFASDNNECFCDETTRCDEGCDCDPECDDGGCAGVVTPGALALVPGGLLVALGLLRQRRRRS